MNQVLIAEVRKKFKFGDDSKFGFRSTFVSFDREELKNEIEKRYEIELVKDEADDFPYFTDGGFKYSGENENWIFEAVAHWYDII